VKICRVVVIGSVIAAVFGIADRGRADSANADAVSLFHAYLENPTPARARDFIAALSVADQRGEAAELDDHLYDQLPKLQPLVVSGRPDALTVGWALTAIADGGFLEDVYVALGEALDSNPRASLSAFAAARPNPAPAACRFATMLAPSFGDDAAAQQSEINRRIVASSSVQVPALRKQRDCIVSALTRFRDEIRRSPTD
jgi:hypothetical protein